MHNYEMLIDRLRSIAVKGEAQMVDCRTLHRAADALENQENELKALRQITEKQAGLNQNSTNIALELDRVKAALDSMVKRHEMACGERDVVTERMLYLEQENAALLKDFRQSLLGDPCDYCVHCFHDDASIKRCEDSNCDCEVCQHTGCPCNDCFDLDKWIWRGNGV